jgi:hypothetical protein
MTRISIAFVAALALAVCACERQPVPGQTIVTHTHASNGHPQLEAAHHDEHGKHPEPAKKEESQPTPAGQSTGEQKPSFFPEKK